MRGSSLLQCVFFFLPLCLLVLVLDFEWTWCEEEQKNEKKKYMLISCFSHLCTIFTVFSNRDNSILDQFCCFFTCGTCETHLLCGKIRSSHIHGVRILFHTMVWNQQGPNKYTSMDCIARFLKRKVHVSTIYQFAGIIFYFLFFIFDRKRQICKHKFIVVICVFLNICIQFDFTF